LVLAARVVSALLAMVALAALHHSHLQVTSLQHQEALHSLARLLFRAAAQVVFTAAAQVQVVDLAAVVAQSMVQAE
jgi:hypothetical protein